MNVHFVVSVNLIDRNVEFYSIFLGNPKCFSTDDYVSMANGETKVLGGFRLGDRVLVMNSEQNVVEDEVLMMLDSQPKRPGGTVKRFNIFICFLLFF